MRRRFSPRLAGLMASALYVAAGIGTILSAMLPAGAGYDREGVVAVAVLALCTGVIVATLPWERWHPRTSLLLVPIAFALIAAGNHFAGAEPFRYGIYYVVAFVWLGFAHPPRTSLYFLPLFVLSYFIPLWTTETTTAVSMSSIVHVGPICLAVGESMAWVSSRLREADVQLQRAASEARFRSLVQNASDVILILNREATIMYESPSVEKVLGYRPEQRIGGSALENVHRDDLPTVQAALAAVMSESGSEHELAFRVQHVDGSWRTIQAIAKNLFEDPHVAGLLVNCRDVTERRDLEEQLRHQAFHDGLTGLPNRALFSDRVKHALDRAGRTNASVAVLFLDLDDFKTINDSLGHGVGDDVLRIAAQRVGAQMREGDTAARLGGDEFAVLLEDVDAPQASIVADRILESLRSGVSAGRRELSLSASIGVVVAKRRSSTAHLLRDADVAMYRAKEAGKDRVVVFRGGMQRAAATRLRLREDLERALQDEQFMLCYQPVVDVGNGELRGVEALLRWQHPRRGMLMPDDFIPAAEQTGQIVQIGRWVLFEACREGASLLPYLQRGDPLTMSVNVAAKQLQDPDFPADVEHALLSAGLSPSLLVLEMTETAMVEDTEATRQAVNAVKSLGVRVVIDDFGTGYSSLNYLRQFPIDGIKIDRSFIADMHANRENAALVESILALSRALHLESVAEGVERIDQLARLRTLGADLAQGYYFAKPLDPAELRDYIRAVSEPAEALA